MMRFLFLLLILPSIITYSQTGSSSGLQQTAKTFMLQGDFDNAIVVLNRALQQDKNNLELEKDLVQCYYYKRDYTKAIEGIKSVIDRKDADEVSFQIAGNVYKAIEDPKGCEKVYKMGLKKFPKSGPLYSEYGELLWARKDYTAIDQWEKGIETDPGYGGNYYNAALYYFYTKDKVWSLVYGEIFVNMETLTQRSTAMKELLFKAYKEKLFSNADILKGEEQNKNLFAKAFLESVSRQSAVIGRGITTESLTMLRTRFILDWFENNATKFPHRLFDYHQQLLREGMFEVYNQWLFGTVENLAAYDNWTKTHGDQYDGFLKLQKSRIFKMPPGQYYQVK